MVITHDILSQTRLTCRSDDLNQFLLARVVGGGHRRRVAWLWANTMHAPKLLPSLHFLKRE